MAKSSSGMWAASAAHSYQAGQSVPCTGSRGGAGRRATGGAGFGVFGFPEPGFDFEDDGLSTVTVVSEGGVDGSTTGWDNGGGGV
jgi:hypothetical protein